MSNIAPENKSSRKKTPEIKRFLRFVKTEKLKWADLAASTEIAERTITNYVYNNEPLGGQLLRKLLEIYGVSIDWIVSGSGDMYVSDACIREDFLTDDSVSVHKRGLIPFIETIDPKNLQDYWWLMAKSVEQSLLQSGATPNSDYSMLDLYKLAQPFVLERFKEKKLDVNVFD